MLTIYLRNFEKNTMNLYRIDTRSMQIDLKQHIPVKFSILISEIEQHNAFRYSSPATCLKHKHSKTEISLVDM
jgi:hypothetical protein